MSIHIQNVSKTYGQTRVLNNISLDIPSGELVALLGPSGSGKTTLLRIIAGLEQPDTGRVLLSGQDATDQNVRDREVGFVFQHYALFRHMTVFENVAFGLKVKPRSQRPDGLIIKKEVQRLLKLVQLDWAAERYPAQLSGGQRQRVALARALAVQPRVLLLDEPFGALDAKVREELRTWLRRLHEEIHVTSVFVTHDQQEALEVASQVVVFNEGHIEQVGSPETVYDKPATPFVYHFLGRSNTFSARGQNGFVRPHEFEVAAEPAGPDFREGRIRHIHLIGPLARLEVEDVHGESTLEVELPRTHFKTLGLTPQSSLFFRPEQLTVFD
ncbi:sulfate/molybdate ABC transporter ATP-binding protein [Deinococcus roseus]|uniref:Sulfate/thiosulfate import ATP-binding protein CysA 2 n=1 Tax=Deinococcus roseus TaxID=392414 RepID=A0ABQ2CY95_9DEIO|nr:sulfate ABC transporter ATP-binding protein [Deinococcus roseus]GGJ28577.1 sulfate/thiosulfate import ATP-binding protein CysA 2 [Deinococcus roseus]